MQTQEQIVEYLKSCTDSLFGFEQEVLLPYLDFEHAKPFLKPEATAEKWPGKYPTEEEVLHEMKTYMFEYGWDKAENHRGLSAGRTIDKMTAWGWMLKGQEFVDGIGAQPYPSYGAPKLKWVCEQFGWPLPDSPTLQNMMASKPCEPTCDSCQS